MNNIVEKYDFFIFDLDDTLIKTENIHYECWLKTLQLFLNNSNFYISADEYKSIFHSMYQNNIKDYLSKTLKIENYEEVIKFKNKTFFDNINQNKNKIKMIEGTEKFLNTIIKSNKQFVIVSNTLKENIDFFTELFPILKHSSKNYYREMLKNKKPDPECYLKVLEDFPKQKFVCFEDSITGIHSISQVPEVDVYFINTPNYIHYDYIIENYKVFQIDNYNF